MPKRLVRYMTIGLAFDQAFTPAVADEFLEQWTEGDQITWADWMRLGRHAKLKGS
jgi:hypothetical protein